MFIIVDIIDVLLSMEQTSSDTSLHCRYHLAEKLPHIVADAAFGSLSMLNDISHWNGHATLSFSRSSHTESWLWNPLSHGVPVNHWRAAVNPAQWIAAIHTMEDSSHNMVTKKIISNAFTADVHQVNTSGDDSQQQQQVHGEGNLISISCSSLLTNQLFIVVRWCCCYLHNAHIHQRNLATNDH